MWNQAQLVERGPVLVSSPESAPRWYAVYTRSRFEKKIAADLAAKRVESYLPVFEEVRQWKDRRKRVEGLVVRVKNQSRLVLSINLLSQSVATEIDRGDVEPTGARTVRGC